MFPDLEEVAYLRCPTSPHSTPPLVTRAMYYRVSRLCGLLGSFCCGGLVAVSSSGSLAGVVGSWSVDC